MQTPQSHEFPRIINNLTIVGYQTKDDVIDSVVWCTSTLATTDGGQALKLGDLSLVQEDADYADIDAAEITIMSSDYSNQKLTEKETTGFVGEAATFLFVSQELIDEAKADPEYDGEWDGKSAGWYNVLDEEFVENFNEYPIPYGSGYGLWGNTEGAKLMFTGSVVKTADMPAVDAVIDSVVWTGNAAPTDMTLADFSLVQEDADYADIDAAEITIMSSDYSNQKLTEKETTGFVGEAATFLFVPQELIDEAKADPEYDGEWDGKSAGWYNVLDEEFVENFNEYPIKAGQGFGLWGNSEGVSLVLPGAL